MNSDVVRDEPTLHVGNADEAELVERAKVFPQAFGPLYELYYGKILSYIYRRTLDATLAEELTSNTFFKALRALPRYSHREYFGAWLYRIAGNEIRSYQRFSTKRHYVELEKHDLPPVRFQGDAAGPEFSMAMAAVGTTIPVVAPPGEAERVKKQHEETKQLIAQKKYKFIKTFEFPAGGQKEYLYEFTHADGKTSSLNFSMRLENVASWEDYLRKTKEQTKQRNEKISRAIAAGTFRLLDIEPLSVHVCREVDSNQKFRVQRVRLPNGKDVALVSEETSDVPRYETSWEEHLQSIRQGTRVLLNLDIIETHTYEITLDDGSTTPFTYAGDPLLKKSQN